MTRSHNWIKLNPFSVSLWCRMTLFYRELWFTTGTTRKKLGYLSKFCWSRAAKQPCWAAREHITENTSSATCNASQGRQPKLYRYSPTSQGIHIVFSCDQRLHQCSSNEAFTLWDRLCEQQVSVLMWMTPRSLHVFNLIQHIIICVFWWILYYSFLNSSLEGQKPTKSP